MIGDPTEQLGRSWRANADAWTRAVREQRIESRRLVTDAAMVGAVLACAPGRVLDVGCGEGWLCRELAGRGVEVVGLDASAPLVAAARAAGGGTYHVLSYTELASGPEALGTFDVAVCNFALLEEDLRPVLAGLHSVLRPAGVLLVQTLHPWAGGGDAPYRDGWRTEVFDGFGEGFTEPMPWFFRTLESWVATLNTAGWRVGELREPTHPQSGRPASLLLACSRPPR